MATHTYIAAKPYSSAESFPLLATPARERIAEELCSGMQELAGQWQLSRSFYLRNLAGIMICSSAVFALWVLLVHHLS